MTTAKVTREFFGVRYAHAEFGARPDLSHPHMLIHPLSEGMYVVVECPTMTAAYIAAHAAIGRTLDTGPLAGRSMVGTAVEVFRAVEHEPVTVLPEGCDPDDIFGAFLAREVTMTIVASAQIQGVPDWATGPLSNYHPVNGIVAQTTVEVGPWRACAT